jgi:type VI secretion system secreted protein VgrG
VLDHWSLSRSLRSGKVELTDYDHLTPNAHMLADRAGAESYQHNALEVFDFPGTYSKQDDGAFYARIRLEAEQCLDKRRQGAGNGLALAPGVITALLKHPRGAENTDYLVVRTQSRIGPQVYRSEQGGSDQGYSGRYQFQILDIPFRPRADAPKPRIHSLQTAKVVGAKGEEIDCDDHGRILVHFPWDRHGDRSCRLRVSQVWSGQGWGGQVIPRIGMEVMVAFLEGDPDRPIVVGCVPNPEDKGVPYELPAKKTKMAWRSTTHKGSGFNELTFEDENGRQNLFMHAEKDHTVKVKNNHTQRVDANALHSVGANHSLQIGSNMSHQVGGGLTQIIGMPPQANAAVDSAAASLLNTDSGAGMAGGGAGLAAAVAGAVGPGVLNQLITMMHNTTTGVAKTETIGVSSLLNIGQTFNTNVGKKYRIEVGEELEIVVGKSRIVMDKDGNVTIQGVKHTHAASGPIQMNGETIDLN